jgi:hypothetical protein
VTENGVGPGSVVAGRFRLEDLLEETDGARFWRATDLTLARNVAVHVLSRDDPRAPAALTAARTSALVSDSHILRVLDAVEQEDVVFLVHEWGTGVSLDQMLADDVLDAKRAAWLVREVAQGIVAGHTMGVAHGRLIPENVMVSEAGSVKLIGFVVNSVLHGRPETMADGREAPTEHESDVLNLGALLYACLVGRWPGFPESSLPPAPREQGRPLRPRRVKAGVPKFLDTLCEDVLATAATPREGRESTRTRYESAASVAEALSRYLGDGGGTLPVVNAFTELGGPTAFVDPSRAPRSSTPGSLGSFDGDPETGEDPVASGDAASSDAASGDAASNDAASGDAASSDAASGDADTEATQAGFALDDSAPGRAVLRSQISDSSAEARAQVDTEERSFDAGGAADPDRGTEDRAGEEPDDQRQVEKTRAARAALGRRSDTRVGEAAKVQGDTGAGGSTQTTMVRPPIAWGPDANATGSQSPVTRARDKPGTLALRLAALVAVIVLIVVGVVFAFDLGSTRSAQDPPSDDDGDAAPERVGDPVQISRVIDFDPPAQGGNGEENADDVGLAADGDPATAWRTQTYFDGPVLAPYKQGVGLVVDLGDENQVRQVELRLAGQGYDVTLFATEPGQEGPPTDIAGLERLGRERGTVDDVTFETDATTRFLVVWFRALPETSGGYAGEVAEIVVRS